MVRSDRVADKILVERVNVLLREIAIADSASSDLLTVEERLASYWCDLRDGYCKLVQADGGLRVEFMDVASCDEKETHAALYDLWLQQQPCKIPPRPPMFSFQLAESAQNVVASNNERRFSKAKHEAKGS